MSHDPVNKAHYVFFIFICASICTWTLTDAFLPAYPNPLLSKTMSALLNQVCQFNGSNWLEFSAEFTAYVKAIGADGTLTGTGAPSPVGDGNMPTLQPNADADAVQTYKQLPQSD